MPPRRCRPASAVARVPTEAQEQAALVQWLRLRPRVLFAHVPNGGLRNIIVARKLRAQGVSPGIPDIIIFDPPPRPAPGLPSAVGVAIELKRVKGGRVSPEQQTWLDGLQARGWLCYVCPGATAAIGVLQGLGY